MRVLVIEDEPKVANAMAEGLEAEGYQVVTAPNGEDGFFRLSTEQFDLVLIDLGLPGRSGLEVLKAARAGGITTPVIAVTARDALEDRVEGLDCGADDYLVKPFAFTELLARIRALLRRGRSTNPLRLRSGDLEMDLVTRRVARRGRPVELTAREFELLEYLMRHDSHVVSREMLGRDVWKETARSITLDNVIDVQIARLRRKIDSDHAVKLIHTIRGIGFMLSEQEP
jgi:two-component system, OmpR family, copper resistance phosphate regulon response regulator CusR